MRIRSSKDLGELIRQKRKEDGLTLNEAANLCNVGYVFLSALENGKPTVQLDKVLQVIDCLGIELYGAVRGWQNSAEDIAVAPNQSKKHDVEVATQGSKKRSATQQAADQLNAPLKAHAAPAPTASELLVAQLKRSDEQYDRVAKIARDAIRRRTTDAKESQQVPGFDILRAPHHGGFKIVISEKPPESESAAVKGSQKDKAKIAYDDHND